MVTGDPSSSTIAILALQGDVAEHERAFLELGRATRRVRRPEDLAGTAGIVLPGGESTTLSFLLQSSELFEPLAERITAGYPVFGTCAGLVLLADDVLDGRADQRSFAALEVRVRRNGYGRQVASFEAELEMPAVGTEPVPAVFIRAPAIVDVNADVEVLARHRHPELGDLPVAVRQGSVLATAFHPELTNDRRVHQLFLDMVGENPGAHSRYDRLASDMEVKG